MGLKGTPEGILYYSSVFLSMGSMCGGILPHYTFKLFLINHLSQGEHWPRVTKEVVVVAGPQQEDETQVCSQAGGGAAPDPPTKAWIQSRMTGLLSSFATCLVITGTLRPLWASVAYSVRWASCRLSIGEGLCQCALGCGGRRLCKNI